MFIRLAIRVVSTKIKDMKPNKNQEVRNPKLLEPKYQVRCMGIKNQSLKPRTRLLIMPFRKTISNQIQKILSRNKNDFILLLQMKPVFQTVQIRLLLLKIRAYSTMCQKLTWEELNKSESNLRSRGKSSMINSMKVIKSLQQ